ncbi:MAG: hypothetical protein Q7R47_06800, partial [Candidatus Diapherotrites archaeon]|nr:hypothetical protein [Candidatus Diapherotrites archaeon]
MVFERIEFSAFVGIKRFVVGVGFGSFNKIGYFEFANVGRWPLDELRGINFYGYVQAMASLPDNCLVGVEPF